MTGPIGSAELLYVFYIIAVVVEAMSAALAAGRKQMDWVGVCLLGFVTALGGGSMRDVLLGNYPLSWVRNPNLLLITVGAALLTILCARFMHRLRGLFLFLDAVGLVVFTVIGCNVALGLGLPFVVVVVAGLITGCMGGVLRDILCSDIPLLFRAELYATVSVITALLYVLGLKSGINHEVAMGGAMAIGLALRLLALRLGWSMPKFIYTHDVH